MLCCIDTIIVEQKIKYAQIFNYYHMSRHCFIWNVHHLQENAKKVKDKFQYSKAFQIIWVVLRNFIVKVERYDRIWYRQQLLTHRSVGHRTWYTFPKHSSECFVFQNTQCYISHWTTDEFRIEWRRFFSLTNSLMNKIIWLRCDLSSWILNLYERNSYQRNCPTVSHIS